MGSTSQEEGLILIRALIYTENEETGDTNYGDALSGRSNRFPLSNMPETRNLIRIRETDFTPF